MTSARDYARAVNPNHAAPLPNNPAMPGHTLTGESLCLWARNTGELYREHVALAARDATVKEWRAHVDNVLVPKYRAEIEPANVHGMARDIAARCLMAYYSRHRIETERLAGVCFPCRHGYQQQTKGRLGNAH